MFLAIAYLALCCLCGTTIQILAFCKDRKEFREYQYQQQQEESACPELNDDRISIPAEMAIEETISHVEKHACHLIKGNSVIDLRS
jgi:hypothetical protein